MDNLIKPDIDLPELDIPELDIDLTSLDDLLAVPELTELLQPTEIDELDFDLTGIEEAIAEFVAGADDLILDFPESEFEPLLTDLGETHEL